MSAAARASSVGGTVFRAGAYLSGRAAIASRFLADDDITVAHRPDERRYELLVGDVHAGELVYR